MFSDVIESPEVQQLRARIAQLEAGHARESANGSGPAFPQLHPTAELRYAQPGVTIRDWFATAAMQGDWSRKELCGANCDEAARFYYAMADAMLRARQS